ncbi:Hypothetical protein, putative [Bodo saltans]|uniref:Uncharacterized protein n=1 Tax=Bodo saltans TaxID=75058 RepID=A0A0S4JUA0_BODSA|nr:Hypothetical protein, putative [Bodo saltans]|eukprot:CUG93816.1 Hypothetical protein, putative [Bodo saltans]
MRQSLTTMSCLTKRQQLNREQRRSHQCNAPHDICGTQISLKLMTGPFLFCSFFLCCVVDPLILANTAQASGVACSAMRNTTACSTNSIDCQWCPAVGACRPVTETCYTSCHQASAAGSAYCTANTTLCKWCPNVGLCAPTADVCYTSCAASSSEGSSYCSSTTTCMWCPDIGLCRATSGQACFTTCIAATANSSACDLSNSCKWRHWGVPNQQRDVLRFMQSCDI